MGERRAVRRRLGLRCLVERRLGLRCLVERRLGSAAWSSAAWAPLPGRAPPGRSAAWASTSQEDAAWASFSYADNAEGEQSTDGEYVDPAELEALGLTEATVLSTETPLP